MVATYHVIPLVLVLSVFLLCRLDLQYLFPANTGTPPLTWFFGPGKTVLKENRVIGGVF